MEVNCVLWFRHGLRLHDNPALLEAVRNQCGINRINFYPVFIFDGESAGTKIIAYNRMKFLLESLQDLDDQLKKILGSGIWLLKGNPSDIFRKLHKNFGIHKICFEQDCEPIWKNRDENVKRTCKELGISVEERISHTLWNPKDVIKANGGYAPLTYEMMLHTINVLGFPARPEKDADFSGVKFGELSENLQCELKVFKKMPIPEDFSIFPLNSGSEVFLKWKGGESRALVQLDYRLKVEEDAFKKGTYLPNHASVDLLGASSSLSAALRFGCLSVRRFYYSVHDKFKEVQDKMAFKIPSGNHITSQLIWREYFYVMSVENENYGQMKDNPICLDIPWGKASDEVVEKWKQGKTGFPIIDAAMRQLLAESWIHHTLRNLTATFLTRTGLWISWEVGFKHFLKYMLDADFSVCAGNWMWVSSSAFEKLLDSSKCAIIPFGQRLDPRGEYIKRYIPELRNMPEKYIHQPWLCPIEIQQKNNIIVGETYPFPMLDLAQATILNSIRMKSIRESIISKPHVRPSNENEIRNFFWIADDVMTKCN